MNENRHPLLFSESIDDDARKQNKGTMEFSARHQPIIGIPILVQQGSQGPLLMADAVGVWAIERMRGRIVLLPLWPFPTHEHIYLSLWPLLQSIDGLFLPAGIPKTDRSLSQKEHQQESEIRSIAWEIALAQLASFLGMPLLALADGAEKWNSALGGKRREAPVNSVHMASTPPETWGRRRVRIRASSLLASSLQPSIASPHDERQSWELAFLPGSGVEQLAPGLRSCAQSEDGDSVAFERGDGAFGLGILGRPDWGLDQTSSKSVFAAFLRASQAFDRLRRQTSDWEASMRRSVRPSHNG